MSDLPFPSAVTNVWPRTAVSTINAPSTTEPIPLGGSTPIGLPTVNNPNLPSSTIRPTPLGGNTLIGLPTINNPNLPLSTIQTTGNIPPPVPQPPITPFPSIRQPLTTSSTITSPYATAQAFPPFNPFPTAVVCNFISKYDLFL